MTYDIGFYDVEIGNPPIMNYSDVVFNLNIDDRVTINDTKYKIVYIEREISVVNNEPYSLVTVLLSRYVSVFSISSLTIKNKN